MNNAIIRQYEQKSLKFSLTIVLLLMIWGLVFNELTDSNIIELDAGSYITSGILGIITIYISKLQDKPSNRSHPLGYIGFIPLLNLIRSFMIILICLKAFGGSIGDLINGPAAPEHGIVFLYASVTLLFNFLAYYFVQKASKRLNADILKVDAVEWRIDIFFNIAILISFSLSYLLQHLGYASYSKYIDPIFCIVLSVLMCISPVRMFSENIKKLTVAAVDEEVQKNIVDQFLSQVPHSKSFYPFITVIDVSGILWVEIQLKLTHKKHLPNEVLTEWETAGKMILKEINPNHHLTFRFN